MKPPVLIDEYIILVPDGLGRENRNDAAHGLHFFRRIVVESDRHFHPAPPSLAALPIAFISASAGGT